MSTTRSQLYRLARDLGNVEAVEHGYSRGGLSGAAGGAAQREARRVIYREGNRQINRFVRAVRPGAASTLRRSLTPARIREKGTELVSPVQQHPNPEPLTAHRRRDRDHTRQRHAEPEVVLGQPLREPVRRGEAPDDE